MKDKLIDSLNEIFETKKIKEKTNLRKIAKWDSLISLNLIAKLDKDYSVTISVDDLKKIKYVKDVRNLIKKKIK